MGYCATLRRSTYCLLICNFFQLYYILLKSNVKLILRVFGVSFLRFRGRLQCSISVVLCWRFFDLLCQAFLLSFVLGLRESRVYLDSGQRTDDRSEPKDEQMLRYYFLPRAKNKRMNSGQSWIHPCAGGFGEKVANKDATRRSNDRVELFESATRQEVADGCHEGRQNFDRNSVQQGNFQCRSQTLLHLLMV